MTDMLDLEELISGLQCPHTWVPWDQVKHRWGEWKEDLLRRVTLAPVPWNKVVAKIWLAYGTRWVGDYKQSLSYLTECYMTLLPGFDTGCELISLYKEALKHVLDCMSFYLTISQQHTKGHQVAIPESLYNFLKGITCYDSLGNDQKAAVVAIRGMMTDSWICFNDGHYTYVTEALRMNPEEGQWHCALGRHYLNMCINLGFVTHHRLGRMDNTLDPHVGAVIALEMAVKLRKNPDSCTGLAQCYRSLKTADGYRKAASLTREMVKLYPENGTVLAIAGIIFRNKDSPLQDRSFAAACYRKAISILGTGPYTADAQAELGVICAELGLNEEAKMHMEKILPYKPEAQVIIDNLHCFKAMPLPQQVKASSSKPKGKKN